MITHLEVNETNNMIEHENLDVRTITLGISLLDCCDSDLEKLNEKIYNKITTLAKDLVPTGKQIERDFGIPIVNKRISVTPIALVGGAACKSPEDFVTIAKTLDRAASVGHPTGIAEVDDILMGQALAQLPHAGQTAQTAVEHTDGAIIHAAFPSFPPPVRSGGR